jgi:transketolase
MVDVKKLQSIATQVRRDIIRMIFAAQSGHPGGSLGCADFMTTLYFSVMNVSPQTFTIDGKNQDMFFLSNGHIAPAWYSVLARTGYFETKELGTLRKLHSKLQGHPTTYTNGVRIASGSLGQGLSVACGAALAKKMNGDPNFVFTLHGDGELQEGQIWEAAMFAAAKKLDNLIATVDYNGKQIDGAIDDVLSLGDLPAKFISFGWETIQLNGNDIQELLDGFERAKSLAGKGKPIVIIMKTEMGQGVDFMMGTHKWHGKAPNEEQTQQALAQLPETLGDY